MKKMMKLYMLALGAAVMLASCQQEELAVKNEGVSKVFVTVGADYGQTKSAVVAENGKRTLTFTSGDRLYVRGVLKEENDPLGASQEKVIVAGYVSPTSISADGFHAQFSGELDVYEGEFVANAWELDDHPTQYAVTNFQKTTFDFADPEHPLDECMWAHAMLVHENGADLFILREQDLTGSYLEGDTPFVNVDELMTRFLRVNGNYEKVSRSFTLGVDEDWNRPILNCSISGLTPGDTYSVRYAYGPSAEMEYSSKLGNVKADADGAISVAFFGLKETGLYHGLRFFNLEDSDDGFTAAFGQKTLENKVYNISREAVRTHVNLNTTYKTDASGAKYYPAQDGQTLAGNFGGDPGYITVADGAKVTLKLSTITSPEKADHAVIHCLGDATLFFRSHAELRSGADSWYPAIYIPEGKTLTVTGSDGVSLHATGYYGAGIGGGYDDDNHQPIHCGNIVIENCEIVAHSGIYAAGIGGGRGARCGDISILGGVIHEAGPREDVRSESSCAGIGTGDYGSCGDIVIGGCLIGGDVNVTPGYLGPRGTYGAVAGYANSAGAIGCGFSGKCGSIRIGSDIKNVYLDGHYTNREILLGGPGPRAMNDDRYGHGDIYLGTKMVYNSENVMPNMGWCNSNGDGFSSRTLSDGNYNGFILRTVGRGNIFSCRMLYPMR